MNWRVLLCAALKFVGTVGGFALAVWGVVSAIEWLHTMPRAQDALLIVWGVLAAIFFVVGVCFLLCMIAVACYESCKGG
jgi:hypothetical protein